MEFQFDDLHIAVNRNQDIKRYDTWAILDAIITAVVAIAPLVHLIRRLIYLPTVLVAIIVFIVIYYAHIRLQKDYQKRDAYVRKIYIDRVFNDYYEGWLSKYLVAKREYEKGVGEPPKRYIDIYRKGINGVLVVHLLVAIFTVIAGFIAQAHGFVAMIFGTLQLSQAIIVFQALSNLLDASFDKAYAEELKRPRP